MLRRVEKDGTVALRSGPFLEPTNKADSAGRATRFHGFIYPRNVTEWVDLVQSVRKWFWG
jgi:hypothetical protein